jgi:hypothetical protein
MLTQAIPFDAAEPKAEAALAADADPFVSHAYVYLLRVVVVPPFAHPSANIPRVLLPAAEPRAETALAAVAEPLVSLA